MKKIKQTIVVGKEEYKKRVIEMIDEIENPVFLKQIWTILKRHIEK